MRYVIVILLLILSLSVKAQNPAGVPTQIFTGKWYQYKQYIEADSGILMVSRDTNFVPRQPVLIFRLQPGIDTSFYAYNGVKWVRQLNTRDLATALSGTVTRGDSLVVFATPTSAKRYSDSLYNRSVKYTDSTTKYITPTQGATLYYPRTGNPSGFLTTNQTITLTGDVSGSGTTTISVSVNRFGGQLPAYYLDRTNHFGSQPINTITGLESELDTIRYAYDSAYYSNASINLKRINGQTTVIPIDSLGVFSFNGRFGTVTSRGGDYITDSVAQGTINLYYKDSLARRAIGVISPLNYNSVNGIISIPQSGMSSDGYLSSADYNLFKAAATPIDTSSLSNRINLKVDTIYQNFTRDSLIYTIGGRRRAIYSPSDTIDASQFIKYSDTSALIVTYTSGDDRYVVRESQTPISTLTPSFVFQKRVGDTTVTITAGYGRRSANSSAKATANIASVVVDGVSRTFTNPSTGVTNTVPVSVTFTGNTNRTVNNVVTTIDGKSSTSSISGSFAFTYYTGYSLTNSPSDADLYAGSGNTFPATSKVKSGSLAAPGATSYIFFAYPASLGTATISIGPSIVTYTLIQRSVANTDGFSEMFNIYVSPFPTAGGVTYSVN